MILSYLIILYFVTFRLNYVILNSHRSGQGTGRQREGEADERLDAYKTRHLASLPQRVLVVARAGAEAMPGAPRSTGLTSVIGPCAGL